MMIDTGPKFNSTIPTPLHDLKIEVTDLEMLFELLR